MPEGQQAASGGSPSQIGGSSPVQTDWETQKRNYENQLRGLSEERNRYKQQAEAWGRLGQEAGDAVRYDPVTGLPVDWNLDKETPNSGYAPMVNPWQEVGVDANQAQAWLTAQLQAQLGQYGFVTQQQAEQLATQKAALAYQAANQRFLTQRSVDKLLSDKNYGDLAKPDSDWSKRTASYLQQYGAGKPAREGAGWDEWEYTGPQVLQQAADITYAQMVREQQSSNASQQQAIQNQQAAGLAGAFPGVASQPAPADQFDRVVQQGGDPLEFLKDVVNKDVAARKGTP